MEDLRAKVAQLPTTPGVYLFKDAAGVVLYVGKANNLRSRVGSYLQPSADLLASRGPEIRRLIEDLVEDVDYLECESEVDALLRDLERVIRQRNALLRQAGGRLTPDVETTLDVWDAKLADTGEAVAAARAELAATDLPSLSGF